MDPSTSTATVTLPCLLQAWFRAKAGQKLALPVRHDVAVAVPALAGDARLVAGWEPDAGAPVRWYHDGGRHWRLDPGAGPDRIVGLALAPPDARSLAELGADPAAPASFGHEPPDALEKRVRRQVRQLRLLAAADAADFRTARWLIPCAGPPGIVVSRREGAVLISEGAEDAAAVDRFRLDQVDVALAHARRLGLDGRLPGRIVVERPDLLGPRPLDAAAAEARQAVRELARSFAPLFARVRDEDGAERSRTTVAGFVRDVVDEAAAALGASAHERMRLLTAIDTELSDADDPDIR